METILITGTSSGLGYSLAEFFSTHGYKVVGLSRRPVILNENYTHVVVDISDEEQVKAAISNMNHIDILINNAAVFKMESFESTQINTIDNLIDTNIKGTMYVTSHALKKMPNGSKIVFINSVAGLEELEFQSIYCACKYSLTAFAGVLGKELKSRQIRVSSIHPGGINTPLWNESNPYPVGNVEDAMPTSSIIDVINMIISSKYNIDYKTIKMFPTIEWHN